MSLRLPLATVLLGLLHAGPAIAAERLPHLPEDGTRDGRWHLRLDTDAVWGIGGQMYLGAQAHLSGYTAVWTAPGATGSIDLGVQAHYGNEATWLAPWIDPDEVSGATHRVQVVGTVGHTFHLGTRRRWSLGLAWYAGWNHWRSDHGVTYAAEDVHGHDVVTDDLFVTGGQVRVGWRVHRHVGLDLVVGAPVPTASSYAVTLANVGLGLSFFVL
jgi:hypothetical protein